MSTNLATLPPLASAIAQAEGYGVGNNNIPTLANNPGSLELGDVGYGTLPAAGGNQITVFGTLEDGWTALTNQINKIYNGTSNVYTPNMTLQQFGNTYSGGNTNYANNLAGAMGVSPSTPLSSLPGASPSTSTAPSSSGWGTFFNPFATQQDLQNALPNVGSSATTTIFSSRLILILLGLILFAAGVFAFKQTQNVLQVANKGVKTGKKILEATAA